MNKQQLDKIIRNYMDKFDVLNNKEHAEYDKWIAVSHFQDHWNMDADDFGEMFKEALRKSGVLIDGKTVQPSNGITFLCKKENGYMEEVRLEFKKLLEDDHRDYVHRLGKIDSFVANINAMLEKVAPGKWKYEQNRRAAIMYLSFIEPDSNYMFKSTSARAFADCIEFGDDIGSGQTFSLRNYYRLCKELMFELQNYNDFINLYDEFFSKFKEEGYNVKVKDSVTFLHILVYDLIYCTIAYDLYDGIIVKKNTKASSIAQRQKQHKQKIEQLLTKIDEINAELEAISSEIEEIGIPNCVGLTVNHTKYGLGEIKKQDDKHLTVKFGEDVKKFEMPDAIAKGYLKPDSNDLIEDCKRLVWLFVQQERLVKDIRDLNIQLENM